MGTRRPQPGEPLSIKADDMRRMLDAADYYAATRLGNGVAPMASFGPVVKLRNDSGEDRELGEAMEVGDLLVNDIETYQRHPTFEGLEPTNPGRSIAVYQEPTKDGDIGRARVSGVAIAKVDLIATHYRASPSIGSHVLTSGTVGPFELCYRPSGTGEQLCWVNMSPRGNFVVARTPSGGIAAMIGSTPGSASCDLYHLVSGSLTAALDEDGATTLTRTIYNIASSAVAENTYIQFKSDCDGTCWVDFEDCG